MAVMRVGIVAAALSACLSAADLPSTHETELVRNSQMRRAAGLRSPNGWLTLVGLFWLTRDRDQTIGSGPGNDFQLPPRSAPAHLGKVRLAGGKVTFTNLAGPVVTVNGKPVTAPV